jgi:hypothetical protein
MAARQRSLTIGAAFVVLMTVAVRAEPPAEENVSATILSVDRQFWEAYNACDVEAQRRFVTEDVEFYHDKGGVTLGADALMDTVRKNLCSGNNRVRREAVEGTGRVFPMHDEGVLYGAIVSGDHRFYVREGDHPETWTGIAKFANLWLLKDGTWKMARVLSYDHGPAPYVSTRKAIPLPDAVLDSLAGRYRTSQWIGTVRRENGRLVLSFENSSFTLHPERESLFFTMERDLTFEFTRRADDTRIIRVRENGAVVDEGVAEK